MYFLFLDSLPKESVGDTSCISRAACLHFPHAIEQAFLEKIWGNGYTGEAEVDPERTELDANDSFSLFRKTDQWNDAKDLRSPGRDSA